MQHTGNRHVQIDGNDRSFLKDMNSKKWAENICNELVTIHYADHNTSIHEHEFVEIVYFTHGVGTHYIDGKAFNISPGCVCVMNPNVKHYYGVNVDYSKNIQVKNLIFYPRLLNGNSENFLQEFCKNKFGTDRSGEEEKSYFHLLQDPEHKIEKCFSIIENELSVKQENYLEVVKCLLETMLVLLVSDRDNQLKGKRHSKSYLAVEKSINYLNQHIKDVPPMKILAREFGFSPEYYSKVFREVTGRSYSQFVHEMRCDEVCRMLLETDYTNEMIAEQLGFLSLKGFYRQFKKCKGMTPREYVKSIYNI